MCNSQAAGRTDSDYAAWTTAWCLLDHCEAAGLDVNEIIQSAKAERDRVLSKAFAHRRAE